MRVLKDLERALAKHYPRRFAEFRKPASAKELAAMKKAIAAELPLDVVALYRWRGGAAGFLVDDETDDGAEGWDFSAPENVVADHAIWKKLRPKNWQDTWLPLFSNGAGDNVCVDDRGRLVGLFHETPNDRTVVAKSLADAVAYVLRRVKAGTWRGAPEGKGLARILAKLEKTGANVYDIFGNDVFRLIKSDPRAALTALAFAEKKKNVPLALVLDYRARAQLAAGDVDRAYETFVAYVRAAIIQGSVYNPPFSSLREGFRKRKMSDYAFAANEAEEMETAMLLDAWIASRQPKPARAAAMKSVIDLADAAIGGTDPEEEVRGWIEFGMSEKDARAKVDRLVASASLASAKGSDLARAHAARAAALAVLGKSSESKSSWKKAEAADKKVAAFWRTFGA